LRRITLNIRIFSIRADKPRPSTAVTPICLSVAAEIVLSIPHPFPEGVIIPMGIMTPFEITPSLKIPCSPVALLA
jgi:hypothetical protein